MNIHKTKNFLITGLPGCGKTTLIKEIISELDVEKKGFFTEEIREKGKRAGFMIVTLSGKKAVLAHKDFTFPYRVSKYSVSVENLEDVGVKEIEQAISGKFLIVIDEIGKMELFSERFKKAVIAAFESENRVLASILLRPHPFCDKLKKRDDTEVFLLTRENYTTIKQEILNINK